MATIKELIANTTSNPADLVFPVDEWGFTSKLRREMKSISSRTRNSEDKIDLLMQTLAVFQAHLLKRKAEAKAIAASEQASDEAIRAATRNTAPQSSPVPATPDQFPTPGIRSPLGLSGNITGGPC